jgi:PAS domain S-box-containing protein
LFGFEKSERLDVDRILQRLHAKDREGVSQTLAKALGNEGAYETEYRVVLPDGRMRWIASRGGVEFDANGKPFLMRGACLDITTRKQAEEAARNLGGRLIQAREEEQAGLAIVDDGVGFNPERMRANGSLGLTAWGSVRGSCMGCFRSSRRWAKARGSKFAYPRAAG